jgi:enterochelin esterase-like enzyme
MPRWSSFVAFLAEAMRADATERQALVDVLLAEHPQSPWVEGNKATFFYTMPNATSVALNLDTIRQDPPFALMTNLPHTTLWHVTRRFEHDDLLDYLLVVNDPMTPLAQERDIVGRMARHWRADAANPLRMSTAQAEVSVLRMPQARPFPDWSAFTAIPRGRIYEHTLSSAQLGFRARKLWVYTPPNYEHSSDDFPLLIFQDGQLATGPLQLPYIVDALYKHKRIEPMLVAMVQSGTTQERMAEYTMNDKYYAFTFVELLPFLQMHYRVDATNLGIGGVAVGAVAAAHAALKNPAVFERLLMISPPLGKGADADKLDALLRRFETAKALPKRIFQSVGRYETASRFVAPAERLRDILSKRGDVMYQFAEIGSGHGLVGFKSVLPEALAHAFPVGVE